MNKDELEFHKFGIEPNDSPEVIFQKRLDIFDGSIALALANINKLPKPCVTQKDRDAYEFYYSV